MNHQYQSVSLGFLKQEVDTCSQANMKSFLNDLYYIQDVELEIKQELIYELSEQNIIVSVFAPTVIQYLYSIQCAPIKIIQMYSTLQNLNLFPYTQLWRMGSRHQHSNKCNVILSIIVILLLLAIFVDQLVIVSQRKTMIASSQTVISDSPPQTLTTTTQSHPNIQPFMIAVDLLTGNPWLNLSNPIVNISAYTDTLTGNPNSTRVGKNTTIPLQQCTPAHFSMVHNIESRFNRWGSSNWLCLPLHQNYTIQGAIAFDPVFSRISFLFNCSGSCMNTFTDMNIKIYTLSTIVNPTNETVPEQYILERTEVPVLNGQHHEYDFTLSENIINTDTSIFPWKNIKTKRNVMTEAINQVQLNTTLNESSTLLYYSRSYKTIVYDRSYYKLLSAISYLGGTFQALLGLFIFTGIIGRVLYQMTFAKIYFNDASMKGYTLKTMFGQAYYNILKGLDCAPDWEDSQQRYQLQKTVNKILDVVFLIRRLDYLERGMSLLLSEHQIKGLYLAHTITKEETNNNISNFQLKGKLIQYLRAKRTKEEELIKKRYNQQQQKQQKKKKKLINKSEMSPNNCISKNPDESAESQTKMEKDIPQSQQGGFEMSRYSRASHQVYQGNQQDQQLHILAMKDLRILFHEAELEDGDQKSKAIYNMLDGEVRQLLKKIYNPAYNSDIVEIELITRNKSGQSSYQ